MNPRPNLLVVALPIVAIVLFVLTVGAIIWSAGSTLGYDFHAYEVAARRLLDGQRMYDPAIDVAGGFAIYLYPPPFALAIVPLAIVGGQAAVGIWTGLMVVAVPRRRGAPPGEPERALARPAARRARLARRLLDQARAGRPDPLPPVRDRLALARPAGAPRDGRSGLGRSSRSSRRS